MIVLRISFEHPEELQQIVKKLGVSPAIVKQEEKHGRYNRAYIRISENACNYPKSLV